ncbi:hypothetical protein NGI46_28435 [Peribacillus butanolivorans]|uniref:hypothetical protein n=1 Tax=Peribacillus butanolivorans TaxID=421767 RepID=UPI00207D0A6D|nr:hypothetical protein [Peribacillus butanolivorans]MCO0601225.1 hypothetical protein [Peribacillus butanolivorans]
MFTSVLFIYFPIAISLLSIWGLFWVIKNKKKIYISPLVLVNLGIITHLVGLKLIRGFEGMGVSMVGAIILGISLIILVLILIIDSNKKRKLKKTI